MFDTSSCHSSLVRLEQVLKHSGIGLFAALDVVGVVVGVWVVVVAFVVVVGGRGTWISAAICWCVSHSQTRSVLVDFFGSSLQPVGVQLCDGSRTPQVDSWSALSWFIIFVLFERNQIVFLALLSTLFVTVLNTPQLCSTWLSSPHLIQ